MVRRCLTCLPRTTWQSSQGAAAQTPPGQHTVSSDSKGTAYLLAASQASASLRVWLGYVLTGVKCEISQKSGLCVTLQSPWEQSLGDTDGHHTSDHSAPISVPGGTGAGRSFEVSSWCSHYTVFHSKAAPRSLGEMLSSQGEDNTAACLLCCIYPAPLAHQAGASSLPPV